MIITTKILLGATAFSFLAASVSFVEPRDHQYAYRTIVAEAASADQSPEARAPLSGRVASNTHTYDEQTAARYCVGVCDWSALYTPR